MTHAPLPFPSVIDATATDRPRRARPWRRMRRRSGFTLIEAALATVIIGTGVLSILAAQQAYHRKNQWASKSGTAMLLANEIRELTMQLPFHDPVTGSATLGPESGETSVANYDDLDDFAGNIDANKQGSGTIFVDKDAPASSLPSGVKRMDGPINALRQVIPDMPGWSQHVRVENIADNEIDTTITLNALDASNKTVMRVTVDVLYKSPQDKEARVFGSLTWIVTPRN